MSLRKGDLLATFERQMADYLEAMGVRLATARERLGLTQRQAADAIGITEKQYWRWEKGVNAPGNTSTWEAIAKALETSVEALRGEMPEALDPESEFRQQIARIESKLDRIMEHLEITQLEEEAATDRVPRLRRRETTPQETPAPKTRRAASGRGRG